MEKEDKETKSINKKKNLIDNKKPSINKKNKSIKKKPINKTKKSVSKIKKNVHKRTLRKQRRKSSKGGKIIGIGSFGCAYRPALRCKDSELRPENTVSKIIDEKDAQMEIDEMKEIHKIDPEYRFHLRGPTKCTIGEFDETIDGKLEDCSISKKSDNLVILNYEDGGMDLHRYMYNKKKIIETHEEKYGLELDFALRLNEFIAMFYYMKPLVEGLKTMNKNNYGHFDIKHLNITVKDNKYRFIDFGFASKYDKASRKVPFFNNYYIWSLETLLLKSWSPMSLEDTIEEEFTKQLLEDKSYKYLLENYDTGKVDIKYTNPILSMIEDDKLTNIIIKQAKEKGMKEYKKEVIEKVDIYSLGVVYTELFTNILGIKFPWTTNDELDVFKGYEEYMIIRQIRDLIYRMTTPISSCRINVDNLVKEYNRIIKQIEDTLL